MSRLLISGKVKPAEHQAVNPIGKTLSHEIDLVTLRAFGSTVNLSETFARILEFAEALDAGLKEGIASLPDLQSSGSDQLISAEFAFHSSLMGSERPVASGSEQ